MSTAGLVHCIGYVSCFGVLNVLWIVEAAFTHEVTCSVLVTVTLSHWLFVLRPRLMWLRTSVIYVCGKYFSYLLLPSSCRVCYIYLIDFVYLQVHCLRLSCGLCSY